MKKTLKIIALGLLVAVQGMHVAALAEPALVQLVRNAEGSNWTAGSCKAIQDEINAHGVDKKSVLWCYNENRDRVFHVAARALCLPVMEALINGKDIGDEEETKSTDSFCSVSDYDHLEGLKLKNGKGKTAYECAVEGAVELVKTMLGDGHVAVTESGLATVGEDQEDDVLAQGIGHQEGDDETAFGMDRSNAQSSLPAVSAGASNGHVAVEVLSKEAVKQKLNNAAKVLKLLGADANMRGRHVLKPILSSVKEGGKTLVDIALERGCFEVADALLLCGVKATRMKHLSDDTGVEAALRQCYNVEKLFNDAVVDSNEADGSDSDEDIVAAAAPVTRSAKPKVAPKKAAPKKEKGSRKK